MARAGTDERKRIAIACQGGGSHTAFTAGALKVLLGDDRYDVVALSGTSGGGVCAFLAWYGLCRKDRKLAVSLLDSFWSGMSATTPWDMALNWWVVGISRLEGVVALPAVSPYHLPTFAQEQFRRQLERLVPPRTIRQQSGGPLLLVGAVDVVSGEFRAFSSARREITIDAVLASAAIPNLFRAVPIDGASYWDGLFSQNPPVRELPDARPDEIWVVKINPFRRESVPTSVPDIIDRRNELSGNLSLRQELFFIDKINELVRTGAFKDTKYKEIGIEFIDMEHDLDTASKLDRSAGFITDLIAHGEEQARTFLRQRLGAPAGAPR